MDLGQRKSFDDALQALRANVQTEIRLAGLPLDHETIMLLCHELQCNTRATTLVIFNCVFKGTSFRELASELHRNTTLTTLSLYGITIGDRGAQYLSDMLRYNVTLTTLKLHASYIGDLGAPSLAEALLHNSSLKTLFFFGDRIGASGSLAFATAMRTNIRLTSFGYIHATMFDHAPEAWNETFLYRMSAPSIENIDATLSLADRI